jgi:hypothetical protein
MVCVTVMLFPQSSVTEYNLVSVSGQLLPSERSLTKDTTGFAVQLSTASVIKVTSGAGISADKLTVIVGKLEAVGRVVSSIVIV